MTSLQSTTPRHRLEVAPLRIALIGTAGGCETAAEEIGQRLAERGHAVTVYGSTDGRAPEERPGVRFVRLPARSTPTRTALATAHLSAARRQDVAFLLDATAAPFVPLLQNRGTAVAVHVDGPERQRDTWGRRYRRMAEQLAVREADALVVDAPGVADAYEDEFHVQTEIIRPGTRIVQHAPTDAVEALGLLPGAYHLVTARSDPEHRVDVVLEGYHRSDATMPLVVIGSAPSRGRDAGGIGAIADRDHRVRLLGDVPDSRTLDQLHAHALSSLHAQAGGGTDAALLRAMGAGTAVVAWDVAGNREVAGTAGSYFRSPAELARDVEEVERYPFRFRDIGEHMQERAQKRHTWDRVAEAYGSLAARLARGYSTRGMSTGRRSASVRSLSPVPVELPRA